MRAHAAPRQIGRVVSDQGKRRIDRISRADYVESLDGLTLEEVRARRDECLAEREYLSLLRRLVQGRAEILKAEVDRRGGDDRGPIVDRLSEILSAVTSGPSRGEAVRIAVPEEEMLLARRRVERLVADTGISDPGTLDDDKLNDAVELLVAEEREVSSARATVLRVLDDIQDELKRRYKDDPSLVLS
jgi:hypothetical protein